MIVSGSSLAFASQRQRPELNQPVADCCVERRSTDHEASVKPTALGAFALDLFGHLTVLASRSGGKIVSIGCTRSWCSPETGGQCVTSYIINSNLSERQIEADVATYLGWCAQGLPFRLLDVNEQATGADRLCDVTVPVYLQFKKSQGLRPLTSLTLARRANESPLQGIRRFRRRHELADDPTLYFQLRKKADGAHELQHNLLLAHHQPQTSYAVYVAPLYLDRDRYYEELCQGPRLLDHPWDWRPTTIWHGYPATGWLSRFDRQPFLRNHISIAPHERVASHNHYYAFASSGDQVSWHSPSAIDGGPFRLSDFMSARLREIFVGDSPLPDPRAAWGAAAAALQQVDMAAADEYEADDAFERLRQHGRWLFKSFAIRQVLLCARKKEIEAIRETLQAR